MIEFLQAFVANIWQILLSAAPWLMIGLIAAAVIRAWIPHDWVVRAMGRRGVGGVVRASVVGVPLPLCSCGVLPTALGLRRQGASRSSTVAFLVATPEIGAESFALSYALLGPFMAIARPVAAFFSAIAAGLAALWAGSDSEAAVASPSVRSPDSTKGCDGGQTDQAGQSPIPITPAASPCCGSTNEKDPVTSQSCCGAEAPGGVAEATADPDQAPGAWRRLGEGLHYVMTRLLDDVAVWLGVAIVLAAVMVTIFPEPHEALARWGSGLPAMIVMLLAGVPIYICAAASTPIAASLLIAGVSPGTVLVFLLAGPATNIGSIGVLRKELGTRTLIVYLLSIAVTSVAAGLITDAIVHNWQINIIAQAQEHAHDIVPAWLAIPSAMILLIFAIRPIRRLMMSPFGRRTAGQSTQQGPSPVNT